MIKITWGNRHSTELKRYVLFAFSNYYPCGGWSDMRATSDDVIELKHYEYEESEKGNHDHAQILDMDERKWHQPRNF